MLTIVNTTFTCKVSEPLDLPSLAEVLWDSEYNPRKFPSIVMRLRKPKATVLISKNGHIVVVGCKSELEARKTSIKVLNRINKQLKLDLSITRPELKNMVASGVHDFDLRPYWNATSENVSHEAEIFPGIRVGLTGGMSATIFGSGKFFITGAKCTSDLESAHLELLIKFYF